MNAVPGATPFLPLLLVQLLHHRNNGSVGSNASVKHKHGNAHPCELYIVFWQWKMQTKSTALISFQSA
jgi:hypothetical protein